MTDLYSVSLTCPLDECQCDDWPPTECPQCGVTAVGFTPEDWCRHFHKECDTLGALYCFAQKPEVRA